MTDFSMPGMNGGVLIGEARRRRPALPVLMLTGYADLEPRSSMDHEAAIGTIVLRKPVSSKELAERVAALLDRPEPALV